MTTVSTEKVLNLTEGCDVFLYLQLDNVWVSEQFEILDLSFDFPHDIETANPLSVQDLHGHFMACQLVLAN